MKPVKDLSQPRFNSSKNSARAIRERIEEIEKITFEKEIRDNISKTDIQQKSSRTLNVQKEKRIFIGLCPLEPSNYVKDDLAKRLQEEYKNAKEDGRPKDWQPILEDYQKLTCSRLKGKVEEELEDEELSGCFNLSQNDYLVIEHISNFKNAEKKSYRPLKL